MYAPLKLIKDLLTNDTKLFKDEQSHDVVKDALAILMSHIIIADGIVTKQERAKIFSFFGDEFAMNAEETKKLFDSILDNMHEFETHIEILTDALKNSPTMRAELLRHLNNIIICDGCKDSEYALFDKIINSL